MSDGSLSMIQIRNALREGRTLRIQDDWCWIPRRDTVVVWKITDPCGPAVCLITKREMDFHIDFRES